MPGVSKHYMYSTPYVHVFDKKALQRLMQDMRPLLSSAVQNQLFAIPESWSWRKRLLAAWDIAKNLALPEIYHLNLKEFKIRKGLGWKDNKNSFKQHASMFRKFKPYSRKKGIPEVQVQPLPPPPPDPSEYINFSISNLRIPTLRFSRPVPSATPVTAASTNPQTAARIRSSFLGDTESFLEASVQRSSNEWSLEESL